MTATNAAGTRRRSNRGAPGDQAAPPVAARLADVVLEAGAGPVAVAAAAAFAGAALAFAVAGAGPRLTQAPDW